jgi:hypothetical protein
MTLPYEQPDPSKPTTHDHIYTTLLVVLAFFLILGISTLVWLRINPNTSGQAKSAYLLPLMMESAFLLAIIVGIGIRLFFPHLRRWPTLALNIILLACVPPFGTALAIYGFWKVDRKLRG